jgi:hypothetical protein
MFKFLLNLLIEFFQDLPNSKIHEIWIFPWDPSQLAQPPHFGLLRSAGCHLPCSAHLAHVAVVHSPEMHFLFRIAHSRVGAFSLSCHNLAGPAHQFHPPPNAGRSPPCRRLTPPPPATPRHQASNLETPSQGFNSPALIPPQNPHP